MLSSFNIGFLAMDTVATFVKRHKDFKCILEKIE